MSGYDRLAPFIQDYIFRNRWESLRDVQEAACVAIFDTDKNLLLSTGTASGKTEAAFLPTLTLVTQDPPDSVAILYVSPLKALINDQFSRLENLLKESKTAVCKWHGDAPAAAKARLLASPSGVLQTTPESLESLLMNKRPECKRIFSDLRFVIIDEVHHFMESPRGVQLICILERIQRLSKCNPRRIGLSATLSDTASAERWLNAGSGRECVTPKVSGGSRVVALRMKRFICSEQLSDEELEDLNDNDEADATRTSAEVFKSATVDHCRYLYSQTRNKKAIIFARSRAEVEDLISGVKRVAEMEKSKDIYYTHHSSISAALREEAEAAMKNSDEPTVIGATLTLELGIDIGALDRVIQVGAPISVSSFTQRVGRCGRKGQRSELIFTFVEKPPKAFEELDTINWEFVKCVAVIELYLRDRWVEPAFAPSFPYGILYHQTMCHLASVGEATAPSLAQNVLSLSAFSHVPLEDYRELLSNMLEIGHIVRSERGFMVGKDAESKVAFYEFLCVFENSVEYTVKHDVKTIGTITGLLPVGVRFALAGRTWEVVTIAEKGKTIFVKPAAGRRRTNWVSSYSGTVHPVLVQKMKTILSSDEKYGYLSPDCQERLDEIRNICNEKGILDHPIAKVGKRNFCVFPWIGSQSLSTLLLALQDRGVFCTIKPTPSNPIYLETTVSRESYEFEYDSDVDSMIKRTLEVLGEKIDRHDVILPAEIQTPGKFNKFIPKELLAKQFVEDFLTDVEPCL